MAVYVNNITLNSGASFSQELFLDNSDGTPLNLTGYVAAAHIRKHAESSKKIAEFNISFVDRPNGKIKLSLASSITQEIDPGRYVYDILLIEPETNTSLPFFVGSGGINVNTITFTSTSNNFSFTNTGFGTTSRTVFYDVDYILSTSGNGSGTRDLQVQASGTRIGLDDMRGAGADNDYDDITVTASAGTFSQTGNVFKYRLNSSDVPISGGKKSIVVEGMVLAREDISTECVFVKLSYPYQFGGLVFNENGSRIGQSFGLSQPLDHVQTYAEIGPNQISDYGVIRTGFWSNCGSLASHVPLIQNNLTGILDYIENGGVFIVNGEHGGCGDATNMNTILTLLGSTIRCVGQSINVQGLVPKNSSIPGLELFPDNWNFAASDHFTGGTELYTFNNGTNRLIVFEKIGFGAVVATADVNTYTNNQTGFSGPGPHPNETVYNAFRSLVTNF